MLNLNTYEISLGTATMQFLLKSRLLEIMQCHATVNYLLIQNNNDNKQFKVK